MKRTKALVRRFSDWPWIVFVAITVILVLSFIVAYVFSGTDMEESPEMESLEIGLRSFFRGKPVEIYRVVDQADDCPPVGPGDSADLEDDSDTADDPQQRGPGCIVTAPSSGLFEIHAVVLDATGEPLTREVAGDTSEDDAHGVMEQSVWSSRGRSGSVGRRVVLSALPEGGVPDSYLPSAAVASSILWAADSQNRPRAEGVLLVVQDGRSKDAAYVERRQQFLEAQTPGWDVDVVSELYSGNLDTYRVIVIDHDVAENALSGQINATSAGVVSWSPTQWPELGITPDEIDVQNKAVVAVPRPSSELAAGIFGPLPEVTHELRQRAGWWLGAIGVALILSLVTSMAGIWRVDKRMKTLFDETMKGRGDDSKLSVALFADLDFENLRYRLWNRAFIAAAGLALLLGTIALVVSGLNLSLSATRPVSGVIVGRNYANTVGGISWIAVGVCVATVGRWFFAKRRYHRALRVYPEMTETAGNGRTARTGPPAAGSDNRPSAASSRLPDPESTKPPDIGICFSGGGIRSAAYALGALQQLQQDDALWDRVADVSAVSGGSYMASAHAIANYVFEHEADAAEAAAAAAANASEAARAVADAVGADKKAGRVSAAIAKAGAAAAAAEEAANSGAASVATQKATEEAARATREASAAAGKAAKERSASVAANKAAMAAEAAERAAEAAAAAEAKTREEEARSRKPYAPDSREERYLRNHTNYLAPTLFDKIRAAGEWSGGLLFNLVVVGSLLWLVAAGAAVLVRSAAVAPQLSLLAGDSSLSVILGFDVAPVMRDALAISILIVVITSLISSVAPNGNTKAITRRFAEIYADVGLALLTLLFLVPAASVLWDWLVDVAVAVPAITASVAGVAIGGWLVAVLKSVLAQQQANVMAAVAGVIVPIGTVVFLSWAGWAQVKMPTAWFVPLLGLAIVFVGGAILIPTIRPSMYPFYQRRLKKAFSWIDGKERTISLTDLANTEPRLTVCAAANYSPSPITPPGRSALPYAFSSDQSGLESDGGGMQFMANTAQLSSLLNDGNQLGRKRATGLEVIDASAISGAAVSPTMGKRTMALYRALLALLNVRLGVWVPNPLLGHLWESGDATRFTSAPRHLPWFLKEVLGQHEPTADFTYLTDGGHYDNLGLLTLLRKGHRRIICFDAGGEDIDRFTSLAQAMMLAEAELNIQMDFRPTPDLWPPAETTGPPSDSSKKKGRLRRASSADRYPEVSKDHTVVEVTFPDEPSTGVVIYCKTTVTVDTTWSVKDYRLRNPNFPNIPTLRQLYDDERFEAYRELGEAAGPSASSALNAWETHRGVRA